MRWLRALCLSNGFAVGALYGFVPVLLLSKGFDPALIGLTTSLGSLAYSLALPAWGHMGDILTGPRRALQLACIPAAVFALGLSAPFPVWAVIVCQVVINAGAGPAAATYISVRIADLGGDAVEIGLSNGLAWGAEVPGLVLAGWLVARVGLRPVLAVSAAGFAACLASWIVFVDAGPILFTRFLSGVFFGGILVTFVLTTAQLLPWRLQATGQTLFQAVAFGVAAVLANLLGGILYSVAGPLGAFGGGAACALAGGVLGFLALPEVLTARTPPVPEPMPLGH